MIWVSHYCCIKLPLTYSLCCSVTKLCLTLCDLMDCSTPSFPVLHYLLEFTQTHVHWVDDTIQPSHPLSSPFPSALNLSQHQGVPMSCFFASSGQSIKASASVLPVNIQGWFPLGIDWFDLLTVQGIPKSLLQHHNSKASILQCSTFFMVHKIGKYITTSKTEPEKMRWSPSN